MKQTIVLCPEFFTEHRQSPAMVIPHRLRAYLDLRLLPRPVGLLPFDALCPLSFSAALSVYVQGGVVWYLVQPQNLEAAVRSTRIPAWHLGQVRSGDSHTGFEHSGLPSFRLT